MLTWGAGRFGQLGNQVAEDCAALQNITRLVGSEAETVVQVTMAQATGRLDELMPVHL